MKEVKVPPYPRLSQLSMKGFLALNCLSNGLNGFLFLCVFPSLQFIQINHINYEFAIAIFCSNNFTRFFKNIIYNFLGASEVMLLEYEDCTCDSINIVESL